MIAHLRTQETRKNPDARMYKKLGLVKLILEKGLTVPEVQNLYRLIDWLMHLPHTHLPAYEIGLEKIYSERQVA